MYLACHENAVMEILLRYLAETQVRWIALEKPMGLDFMFFFFFTHYYQVLVQL